MNKKLILSSLNEIANNCDEKGLFVEANALTNVMLRISQNYMTMFDDKINKNLKGDDLSSEYFNWYYGHLSNALDSNNLKEAKGLYLAGLKKITNPNDRDQFIDTWNSGISQIKNKNFGKNLTPDQLATVNSQQPVQQPQQRQPQQPQQRQPQQQAANQLPVNQQQPQQAVNQQQNMSRAQIAQRWINQTSPTVGGNIMQLYQMAEKGKMTAKTDPERLKFNDAMAILESRR